MDAAALIFMAEKSKAIVQTSVTQSLRAFARLDVGVPPTALVHPKASVNPEAFVHPEASVHSCSIAHIAVCISRFII